MPCYRFWWEAGHEDYLQGLKEKVMNPKER
jgi:hypothetical protein